MECNCKDNDRAVIPWVRGNRLPLVICVYEDVVTQEGEGSLVHNKMERVPYEIQAADTVTVVMKSGFRQVEMPFTTEDNKVLVTDNGELAAGTYTVEVTIVRGDGARGRWQETRQVRVYENTSDAQLGEMYAIEADLFFYAKGDTGNGIADITSNPDDTLTITMTDGTTYTTQAMRGEKGDKGDKGDTGTSIVSFEATGQTDVSVVYTVTFSDDTTQEVAVPKGPQGDTGLTGNGIASTTLNSDYTLTVNYTDGTSYTTPSIRGAQGVQGVSVIGFTQTGETETNTVYNLVFSDGRTQSVAIPKGAKGDKGDTGNTGPQGSQGPKGDTVTATDYTLYNVQGSSSEGAMSQDATTKAISAQTGYYTCGTAAGTAAKVVTVENGNLYKRTLGGHFKVKMTNVNTAASGVTLQIGSETAAPLLYNGEAVSASNTWEEGEVISVYFDGTNYQASNAQGGGGKAEKIKYDNSQSRLAAENVQEALDEVDDELTELSGEIHKLDGLTEPIPMSYTEGKYINSDGNLVSDASWMASDFLDISTVAAGDIFVWSGIKNKSQACLVFYAEDGTFMQSFSALGTSRTITIANKAAAIGATKVRASFLIDGVPSLIHNNADVLAINIHYTIRGLDNVANGLDNLSKTVENDVLFKRYPSILNNNDFVRGVNSKNGEIISSTTRCITSDLYDMNEETIVKVVNNGQYHLMLTYDTDGTYRGVTTGWIATDATYTFNEACKVRFLVSWDGSTSNTITPSEITVVFTIYKPLDIVLKTDELYSKIGESISFISGIKNCNDSFCRFNKIIKVYNPYKNHPTNQYKGQMHCHTTNSDGALAPSAVVAKYVGYGYDFMTITDHNHITPNPSPESDIVWMGDSYEDTHNTAGLQHMNVWNCSKVGGAGTPSSLVDFFVKNGDSVLSYNHPEYPPVYASDDTLENLPDGISFVEIYNSTIQTYLGEVSKLPDTANFYDMVKYNGKRYINASITKESPNWIETTETSKPDGNLDRGFRIMLDSGKKVFCDAVDDFHRGDNMENRGWQMVFAHSRTKQSIWNGLLMGASYASTGVSLNDVSFVDGVFKLDIADGVNAVTTFYGYNNEVLGTSNGATAIYEVTGDEKYVRAMVEIEGKKAWTQPVWIIDVGNQYEF